MDDINVKALAINDLVILCRAYCDTASDLMIQGVRGKGMGMNHVCFSTIFSY